MGAVTGTEGLRVTHMLYADDLTLTANDPVQLQKMLRRLKSYAARKGLPVNVQKSYIPYQNLIMHPAPQKKIFSFANPQPIRPPFNIYYNPIRRPKIIYLIFCPHLAAPLKNIIFAG